MQLNTCTKLRQTFLVHGLLLLRVADVYSLLPEPEAPRSLVDQIAFGNWLQTILKFTYVALIAQLNVPHTNFGG